MIIYSRDWTRFTPAMVEALTALPNLIAWKDGQGDMRQLQSLMRRVGERLVWIGGAGDDMVGVYYSTGIRAFSSSIAAVAPALSLKLHELASANDTEALAELLETCVIPLYELRSRRKGYEVSAMKALMDLIGLNGGPVRPPLVNVTPSEFDELRTILSHWEKYL
jgi:5-dehydro-4-deoxyglucarate dehydratase